MKTKAAILGLMVGLSGAAPKTLKSVIVSYPRGTPSSVMENAMREIVDAGGHIKHKYTLIMGFAADAPEEALNQVKTLEGGQSVNIEDDQVVTINN